MLIEFDPAKDKLNRAQHGLSLAFAKTLVWDEAFVWLAKAKTVCLSGNAMACTDVGFRYLFGNGGATEDAIEARNYLQRGCDGKEPRGCLGLAGVYVTAAGVPKDIKRARTLLKKACKLGLEQGCTSLKSLDGE